jgi:hypothetical protein
LKCPFTVCDDEAVWVDGCSPTEKLIGVPSGNAPQPNGTTAGERPEQWGDSERLHQHSTLAPPNCHNPDGNNIGAITDGSEID